MLPHPFAIEFHYRDDSAETGDTAPKYQAVITTVSKSFRLFKVSGIRKISGSNMTELDACYHLTTYPLTEAKDDSWKDALTRTSHDFFQAIGHAIEKHIYTTQEVAPYLN